MRHEQVNGAILGTESRIKVKTITLELSYDDAYALCNLLHNASLKENKLNLETNQAEALRRIGRDLGIFVDHDSRHNLGKFAIAVEAKK